MFTDMLMNIHRRSSSSYNALQCFMYTLVNICESSEYLHKFPDEESHISSSESAMIMKGSQNRASVGVLIWLPTCAKDGVGG